MKIAYLTPIYPSPSQTFIRREIKALEKQGFEVHRFTLRRFTDGLADDADRNEERITEAILEAGHLGLARAIVLEAFGRPRRWVKALRLTFRLGMRSDRGLLRHFIYFAESCWLRRRLAVDGVLHLHAHFGTNSTDVSLLCRVLGGPPYSMTIHGPEEFDRPINLSLTDKIHHAAFVVAISQFTRSQLYRWCDVIQWSKLHVVRCGLDTLFLQAPKVPIGPAPRLVNVGRLCEQKGQLALVEAAAKLRARGFDFELVVIGDGPMRQTIEDAIRRFGLQGRVRLTGYLSNKQVRQELLSARALVLPSFAEGLPVAIMESMALGRPVIATYVAGIPELVRHDVTGWLVPASAIDPLMDAMAKVLTIEPAILDQIGRVGSDDVAERHDVDRESAKLAELITARDDPRYTTGHNRSELHGALGTNH